MDPVEESDEGSARSYLASSCYGTIGLENPKSVCFNAGATIYPSGRKFDSVYVAQEGVAKAYISVEGAEVLATIALVGDVLGIDSLHSDTYIGSAISATDIIALWIPPELFLDFFEPMPLFVRG